jgi:hypothetical protein
MIGLVRFVGWVNAAVWFGAAAFFFLVADPAATSQEMKDLLGARNFPFFSVAISGALAKRFFSLYVACAVVALLHLVTEWLYLGKYPRRLWVALVAGLFVGGLLQAGYLQPKLAGLHRLQYAAPATAEAAIRAYRNWHAVSTAVNLLAMAGLGTYLWRLANPPDAMRFVSPSKFRG